MIMASPYLGDCTRESRRRWSLTLSRTCLWKAFVSIALLSGQGEAWLSPSGQTGYQSTSSSLRISSSPLQPNQLAGLPTVAVPPTFTHGRVSNGLITRSPRRATQLGLSSDATSNDNAAAAVSLEGTTVYKRAFYRIDASVGLFADDDDYSAHGNTMVVEERLRYRVRPDGPPDVVQPYGPRTLLLRDGRVDPGRIGDIFFQMDLSGDPHKGGLVPRPLAASVAMALYLAATLPVIDDDARRRVAQLASGAGDGTSFVATLLGCRGAAYREQHPSTPTEVSTTTDAAPSTDILTIPTDGGEGNSDSSNSNNNNAILPRTIHSLTLAETDPVAAATVGRLLKRADLPFVARMEGDKPTVSSSSLSSSSGFLSQEPTTMLGLDPSAGARNPGEPESSSSTTSGSTSPPLVVEVWQDRRKRFTTSASLYGGGGGSSMGYDPNYYFHTLVSVEPDTDEARGLASTVAHRLEPSQPYLLRSSSTSTPQWLGLLPLSETAARYGQPSFLERFLQQGYRMSTSVLDEEDASSVVGMEVFEFQLQSVDHSDEADYGPDVEERYLDELTLEVQTRRSYDYHILKAQHHPDYLAGTGETFFPAENGTF